MIRIKRLLILGIWVAVLPYLGFPYNVKNIFFTVTGLALIYFSFTLRREVKEVEKMEEKKFDNFSENA